jgi:hypothetical protein
LSQKVKNENYGSRPCDRNGSKSPAQAGLDDYSDGQLKMVVAAL